MIKEILTYCPFGKPEKSVLTEKTLKVSNVHSIEVKKLIEDLNDTLDHLISIHGAQRGIGLAAPQIGSHMRVAVVELQNKIYVLINPKIISQSDKQRLFRIGCFSLYQYRGLAKYAEEVTISYKNEHGEKSNLSIFGDSALIVQHELDHLHGKLIFDRLPNKEKDLFVPREKIYTSKKVPLKNYGFVQAIKQRLKIPMKVQTTTQYYSLLFNDSVNLKEYTENSLSKRKKLIKLVEELTPRGGKILEAGCGTSALSVFLSKKGYDLTCCDLDDDMLDLAKRFNTQVGGNVTYIKENILNFTFKDNSFDTIYSHGVLEHFKEDVVVQAINERLRVANRYIFSVPTLFDVSNNLYGDEHLWTFHKWLQLIKKSNGKLLLSKGSFPFHPKLEKLNLKLKDNLKYIAPVAIFVVTRKNQ